MRARSCGRSERRRSAALFVSVANDDFPEMPAAVEIVKSRAGLGEGKHPVDDRLQTLNGATDCCLYGIADFGSPIYAARPVRFAPHSRCAQHLAQRLKERPCDVQIRAAVQGRASVILFGTWNSNAPRPPRVIFRCALLRPERQPTRPPSA